MATDCPDAQTARASLTWADVEHCCDDITQRHQGNYTGVYGVPTGGAFVGLMVARSLSLPLLDEPEDGCLVVDDLVDSGRTLAQYAQEGLPGGYTVDAMIRKPHSPEHLAPDAQEMTGWIVFPWEHDSEPTDAVTRLLQHIGEDPIRDGLQDTPKRVCRALSEMTAGYKEDPAKILARTFDVGCDEMIVLRGIRFASLCEHHLLPFVGEADVAYIPGERVVGISKLARLVQCFAMRLQVQERMTAQIAEAINEHLKPLGVGVVVRASHQCMGCRGVRQPDAEMVTSSMLGFMREDDKARAEVLALFNR